MKRTITLLALVALVLTFLALQNVQSPASAPRNRATIPGKAGEDTRSRDFVCAPGPGVKAARQSAAESSCSTSAAFDPAEPEMISQEQWQTRDAAEPARQGAAEPETPQTSTPSVEEKQPPKQLTPEEKELAEKRSERHASLNWLRDHQSEDGRWSAAEFGAASTRAEARHSYNAEFFAPGQDWGDQGRSPDNDLAVTALVLLSHIGAGFDHKDGEYKSNVRKALLWLRKQQHENGRFGEERDNAFLPTHALCTAAMCECYGLSGDNALKKNCESAVTYLLTLQTKDSGFARNLNGFGLEAEPDVASTAWTVLALKTAKYSGLEFELKPAAKGVLAFFDSVTSCIRANDGEITVFTRLRERGGDSPDGRSGGFTSINTLDAMNCFCRCTLAGDNFDFELCRALALRAVQDAPKWEIDKVDFVHWFFATSVAYQCLSTKPSSKNLGKPDKGWGEWEKAIAKVLLENQRGYKADELKTWPAMLDEFGSWDAVDAYSRQGGRVYTTAMANMCLEIYFRYRRQAKD